MTEPGAGPVLPRHGVPASSAECYAGRAQCHVTSPTRHIACPSVLVVPNEPDDAPAPEAEELGWYAYAPLTGEAFPPPPADGGPRKGAGTGTQRWVLAAWLDAEAAYADGHLADATLQYLQDRASHELGHGAESRLAGWLEGAGGPQVDLRAIVADDARLQALLRHLLT